MRLDQLKEEDIANDPQYKSWLRIYKKSKDAAEAHPKHSTFLKFYNSQTNEGLADMADVVERDHEVQMARSDLYKIAKYAIKLHEMLKSVSEAQGLEGWQQSKITKAADYIGSVFHSLEYEMKFGESKTNTTSSYSEKLAEKLAESKKKVEEKEYKPHMMYKGTKKDYKAEFPTKKKHHDKLKNKGYNHDDPETDKVEEKETKQSGLQYYTGVKKYGKDGMKAIQSAAGKGANHEEIGAIKDKHDKRKKKKNESFQTLEESVGKEITEDEFDRLAEKKDACYHKVKSRYKVWPSAYASGALVQCRKKGAKNWGNKSK